MTDFSENKKWQSQILKDFLPYANKLVKIQVFAYGWMSRLTVTPMFLHIKKSIFFIAYVTIPTEFKIKEN